MLTYSFDDRDGESLYGHLYRCIRRDIESGAIAAHEKLPSKRALAKHLGVSLITVEGAYTQLAAEGYVRSVPRVGFFANELARPMPTGSVRTGAERRAPSDAAAPPASAPASDGRGTIANFASGSVAADRFPFAVWTRTLRGVLAHEPERTLLSETPANGSRRLRAALAGHLRTFRGIEADPDQIVVGAGAQTLYNLIVQLLGRGNRFAVEDPGYPRLTSIYRANDVPLSHVPLDGAGIDVDALCACRADVVHLMPSHQFPTGLVTPASRRYELLGWAAEAPERYIVEDDYDCEFRLAGRPIPAMKSIDAIGRVLYANTFARSLGPAFRIGYVVLPPHLAERFQCELGFYSCTVSTIEQLTLARFIERGDFERHVNRMRARYRSVRTVLVDALEKGPLGDRASVEGADAGLHFLLNVRASASEAAIADAARREGVILSPLSGFYQRSEIDERRRAAADGVRSFVVSYAGIDEASVVPAVDAIARAVEAAEAR